MPMNYLYRHSTSTVAKITKREKTRLVLPIIIPNTMYRFVKRIKLKSDLPSGFSRQCSKNIHDKETHWTVPQGQHHQNPDSGKFYIPNFPGF